MDGRGMMLLIAWYPFQGQSVFGQWRLKIINVTELPAGAVNLVAVVMPAVTLLIAVFTLMEPMETRTMFVGRHKNIVTLGGPLFIAEDIVWI
jgi:hypothetical protein